MRYCDCMQVFESNSYSSIRRGVYERGKRACCLSVQYDQQHTRTARWCVRRRDDVVKICSRKKWKILLEFGISVFFSHLKIKRKLNSARLNCSQLRNSEEHCNKRLTSELNPEEWRKKSPSSHLFFFAPRVPLRTTRALSSFCAISTTQDHRGTFPCGGVEGWL